MATDDVAPEPKAVAEGSESCHELPASGEVVDVAAPDSKSGEAVSGKPDEPNAEQEKESVHSSSSSSGSKSGSSSSSRSRSKSATDDRSKFTIDDHVEVFGMESEKSKFLNGRKGTIVQYIEAHGRFEVCFGPERLAIVRADNLRKCDPPPTLVAKQAEPKNEKPKTGSLADLLGVASVASAMPAEVPPPATYKPLWERSGAADYSGPVMKHKDLLDTEESRKELEEQHRQSIVDMQRAEEERQQEEAELRQKVVDEFAAAGVFDEGMIDDAYREQLVKLKTQRLMRPQDSKRKKRRRSSSSSRSRSKSQSH